MGRLWRNCACKVCDGKLSGLSPPECTLQVVVLMPRSATGCARRSGGAGICSSMGITCGASPHWPGAMMKPVDEVRLHSPGGSCRSARPLIGPGSRRVGDGAAFFAGRGLVADVSEHLPHADGRCGSNRAHSSSERSPCPTTTETIHWRTSRATHRARPGALHSPHHPGWCHAAGPAQPGQWHRNDGGEREKERFAARFTAVEAGSVLKYDSWLCFRWAMSGEFVCSCIYLSRMGRGGERRGLRWGTQAGLIRSGWTWQTQSHCCGTKSLRHTIVLLILRAPVTGESCSPWERSRWISAWS